ncbi:MAG: hypothetical protein ABL907_19825 [Hyphomicrobium sp.]
MSDATASTFAAPQLPVWLTTTIGVVYALVGTAHVLFALMAWQWDKRVLTVAVVIMAVTNIATLEIWRAKAIGWWRARLERN